MIQSADEFVSLRTSDDPLEYGRAASEDASVDTWLNVLGRFPDMRVWVAHNKTVPLEILQVLARDPDEPVRAAVARRRKLDRALFELLSNDPEETVRQRIAYNAKTPADILEQLAGDGSGLVRAAAQKRLSRPGRGPAAES